jgi:hypothetical protein
VTSLTDLTRDVLDSVYSFVQAKDKVLYLNADINGSVTSFVAHSSNAARQIQEGQILQFSKDDSAQAELVRVRSVDTTSNTVTIVRGVLGSTAASWTSIDTEVRIEPEYPIPSIIREINKEITGLPPHIWSYVTSTTTVDGSWQTGYVLSASAVGIQSVQFLPAGASDAWCAVRRYKFDPVNKILTILGSPDPGQPLKIQYRAYPTALAVDADTLTTAGLEDSLRELVVMGATYRLVMKRASGRLVDTRAETPMNQQYRSADPVMAATRQLYAMYQERLKAERERQRLLYPSPLYFTV